MKPAADAQVDLIAAENEVMRRTPEATAAQSRVRRPGRRGDDAGTSLIEVLIAIVLLGTGVVAMLTTLDVTIQASTTERDHANAHAWLQTASDVLYGLERHDCGTVDATDEVAVRSFYESEIKSVATNPEGWNADNIRVVPPVLFWDGEYYQNVCYDDQNINLQLITIEVRNPEGEIVETVQVVKG